MRRSLAIVAMAVLVMGCSTDAEQMGHEEQLEGPGAAATPEETSSVPDEDVTATDCDGTQDAEFPDVVDVELERVGDSEFRVSATLCSAYDTAERYADAWRVTTPDGEVLGVRELLHDHASEQPFTRSLGEPITVPDGVESLVVEGRDLANGWGGATREVSVPEE